MFVYVISCSESLKIYIGQHKNDDLQHYLQQKFYEARNRLKARSHLYAALRKHPRKTWSIRPLIEVDTREECDYWERHFIRTLKSQHPDVGYNICDGGEGFTGTHSEESKRKISVRMRTVMVGNNHGRGNKGIPHPKSAEFRMRVSQTMKGRAKSAEHARHIGDGHLGLTYRYTPESRARMSAMKGRHHSPETLAKMRESHKRRLETV